MNYASDHGESADGREEESNQGFSSEMFSGCSDTFFSEDESSTGISYDESKSTQSSSTFSLSETNDVSFSASSSTTSGFWKRSVQSNLVLTNTNVNENGSSHFERYCKKLQSRATEVGVAENVVLNNKDHVEGNILRSEIGAKYRINPIQTSAMKSGVTPNVPKKSFHNIRFRMNGKSNRNTPNAITVSKLLVDEISLLSEPDTSCSANIAVMRPRVYEKHILGKCCSEKNNQVTANNQNCDGTNYKRTVGLNVRKTGNRGVQGTTEHNCIPKKPILVKHEISRSMDAGMKVRSPSNGLSSSKAGTSAGDDGNCLESVKSSDNRYNNKGGSQKRRSKESKQTNLWHITKSGMMKPRAVKSAMEHNDDIVHDNNCEFFNEDVIELNKDGSITNQKIVYTKINGDPIVELKLERRNEHLMPVSSSSQVLVRVEASTVSKIDSKIRCSRTALGCGETNDPFTPGIDVVGTVQKCGDAATILYGISQNDQVASLVRSGGNAMYISLDASKVVRLPTGISSVSAAVVIETYLPAFQSLAVGVSAPQRYSSSMLHGKNILIIGGITNVGQALVHLALYFGATKVYTTAMSKHHELLRSLGAIPLTANLDTIWSRYIDCSIDIALCADFDTKILDVMKVGGRIVCSGKLQEAEKIGLLSSMSDFIFIRSRGIKTFTYDMFQEWEQNTENSKKDLSYLFGLLKLNLISPTVAGTMELVDVPKAHVILRGKKRVHGTMVCLPSKQRNWRPDLNE